MLWCCYVLAVLFLYIYFFLRFNTGNKSAIIRPTSKKDIYTSKLQCVKCVFERSIGYQWSVIHWRRLHDIIPLPWRHDYRDGVSNHQRLDCLFNRLFRRRSRKHKSSAASAFVRRIHWWPVDFLTKGQKREKCFHLITSSCKITNRVSPLFVDWLHKSCVQRWIIPVQLYIIFIVGTRSPSQYKDRLIYVWRFPC